MATTKQTVVAKLRKQTDKGKLADNVVIAYRLKGGVCEDRVEETVSISAPGGLRIKVKDKLAMKPQGEVSSKINSQDSLALCKLLLDGVDNMVPAAKASFIPDTLIGSVTFAIGDETETFYFEADEEDCEHRGQPIPTQIKDIMSQFNKIEKKHLRHKSQDRGALR